MGAAPAAITSAIPTSNALPRKSTLASNTVLPVTWSNSSPTTRMRRPVKVPNHDIRTSQRLSMKRDESRDQVADLERMVARNHRNRDHLERDIIMSISNCFFYY